MPSTGRAGWVLGGLLLGPALQLRQPLLWEAWAYLLAGAGGLLLAVLAIRAAPAARWPGCAGALLLAGFAGLAFGITGLRACAFEARALPADLQGRDLRVVGVVAAMPQPGELGPRFVFAPEAAWRGTEAVRLPPRMLLSWYERSYAARTTAVPGPAELPVAGDRWEFTVRLKAPHGARNPHGGDAELWFWSQGLQATGYVRDGPGTPARRLGRTHRHDLERARQSVRDALLAHVAAPAEAGVLAALAVGDQAAIDRAGWDLFRATGVAHLVSISGLHVTMFAWAAAAAVGALWRRSGRLCLAWPAPSAALAGGVALAALYAAFSGGGVPSQRTVWMLATVAALRLAGRRWPWPRTWALVAAVVVTVDPWALLQPGFWLSFVAVGVLFATGDGDGTAPPAASLPGRARALLREQAVVTVALAPLGLLLFGQLSLVGLLANLAAIPWVTLVVTPLALGGALWPGLWSAGAWAVQALLAVLQVLASVPLAVLSVAAPPLPLAAAALLGGLLLVLRLPLSLRALGLPLLLPVLLWQPARPAPGEVELLAADIGQGNAVLVRTARHSLLYDTGPRYSAEGDAGHRVLVPLLRALGERLDVVVVSHRDSDHSGGAPSVLAQQPQARLHSSVEPEHPLAQAHAPVRCEAGQRWAWDGVVFEFLHPRAADYAHPGQPPNALSCVLRVQGAGGSALLAGDIEAPQERRLLADGAITPVDLLLVPHHGSKTSSTPGFLDAARPRLALVQAGWRNRFGHPAPAVVARYEARGIEVVATPACGAARWSSARPGQVGCERNQSRRYWQHRP
ncbi:DNA internalization-related competence protein ComEC/Rec2 [Ramlibacter sp. MAHUQ-53]|uniref:DNA internalization-related competence protein ComEC/Rec2 n=1 Tax=unclassified Ramlibacter TaxID=2617605 RepID=UPI003637818C